MRAWLVTLALLLSFRDPSPTPPLTVALVHRAEVQAHQAVVSSFVEHLEGRTDVRVVELGPELPWPDDRQPQVVVAIGPDADRTVDARWPELPRASLLVFDAPPDPHHPPDSRPATRAARFWAGAHTEPACSARVLATAVPEGKRWIVVAETSDADARVLARALDGVLVHGETAGAVAKQLRARRVDGARLWIRGAPALAVPEWLEYLSRMKRIGAVAVGFDLPAGQRFGLSRWVEPDLGALGREAATWTRSFAGRRRPPPLTVYAVPCLTSPISDRPPA